MSVVLQRAAWVWGPVRLWLLALWFAGGAWAAETIPSAPRNHFNDYAGAVTTMTQRELNALLVEHERATSSQIVVAIYPRMLSESSIEDYTVRVAQAWKVGRADRDNGAVLFAFMQDRALYLQVGYGLEGAVPDAIAKRIIEDEIVPRLRAGDVDGGFRAGVTALLAATRGEYVGTGRSVAERAGGRGGGMPGWLVFLLFVVIAISSFFQRKGTVYTSRGHRSLFGPGGGWGGGGFGSGGGGGSFSGGGGSFGGGGAGGRW